MSTSVTLGQAKLLWNVFRGSQFNQFQFSGYAVVKSNSENFKGCVIK